MSRAIKRINAELRKFSADPPPFVETFHVDDTDASKMHFLVNGPTESQYEGGQYVVRLILPQDYPFSAPVISFLTPNGRFKTGSSICIAGVSHFHKADWSPNQNFASLLMSVISFMTDDHQGVHIGSEASTDQRKKDLALSSKQWNDAHGFSKMFAKGAET